MHGPRNKICIFCLFRLLLTLLGFMFGLRKPDTVVALSDEMNRIPKMLIKERDTDLHQDQYLCDGYRHNS
jgi:hypothetical protein